MAGSVHPQAQRLLDEKAAAGVPPLWDMTPEEGRAGVTANAVLIGPGPEVASGCDVVSVEYRLAPEHIFPAAARDAFDAVVWVGSAAGQAGQAGRAGQVTLEMTPTRVRRN